jgi:tetratricopeptide (TPR) repeat protein
MSYEFASYNLLVLGDGISGASSFRADEWDSKSGDEYLISYSNHQKARNHDKWRNRSQRSIDALEKLLKNYPQSPIAEKAKYSIGLIYYLSHEEKLGIKTFKEFVKQFPNSSMADDALISIADMKQADDPERLKTLQELISKYPFGDRRKDADKMIANPYLRSSGYQGGLPTSNVLLGVKLNDVSQEKISISEVSSNSLASKNNIKVGDFISKVMGETMKSSNDVVSKIKGYQPGDIIRVQIIREDKPITFEIDTTE